MKGEKLEALTETTGTLNRSPSTVLSSISLKMCYSNFYLSKSWRQSISGLTEQSDLLIEI
jgi:hypothetical protein